VDLQRSTLVSSGNVPFVYRLMRAVIRFGTLLLAPRLRMLKRESLEEAGPAILLNTHPKSFAVAILLIAALDRQVHCLVPSAEFQGVFRRLACWALGIQPFDCTPEEQEALLNPCLNALADQDLIAIFAGENSQSGFRNSPVAEFASKLAVVTVLKGQGRIQAAIFPVHWLFHARIGGPAPLAYVDNPIRANQFLPKVGEDAAEASLRLVEVVQSACSTNVFSLAEAEIEHLARELESLSREYLQAQWSERPDWKQRPEELQLSGFARRWFDQQNRTNPARLIELGESLAAYREAKRRHSLEHLIVETSGEWQSSRVRVAIAWLETVLGFPAALYGLINHLPAGIVLYANKLFKHVPKRDPKAEWLARIFIVLGFYTIQVFVVDFWWGRAVAGYYTLTLPLSGAYLWRYRWHARHRGRALVLRALRPFRSAGLVRRRERLLAGIDRELERSAPVAAMAGGHSTDPVH